MERSKEGSGLSGAKEPVKAESLGTVPPAARMFAGEK